MARFTLSSSAKHDLTEIWAYIAQDSTRHADRWLARIYEMFTLLSAMPRLGTTSDDIKPGTRKFPLGNYIIYYRLTKRGVQILHVFHAKRNQRAALGRK